MNGGCGREIAGRRGAVKEPSMAAIGTVEQRGLKREGGTGSGKSPLFDIMVGEDETADQQKD